MRPPSFLALPALCLALAACASSGAQYQRANSSQTELEQEQRACRGETSRLTKDLERRSTNSMLDAGVPIGSGGSIQTDQLASDLRNASRQAFEQCMIRRGWSLRQKDAS